MGLDVHIGIYSQAIDIRRHRDSSMLDNHRNAGLLIGLGTYRTDICCR